MTCVTSDSIEEKSTKDYAENGTHSSHHEVKLVSVRSLHTQHLNEVVCYPELDASDYNKETCHRKHVNHIVEPRHSIPHSLLEIHVPCLLNFDLYKAILEPLILCFHGSWRPYITEVTDCIVAKRFRG